VGHRSDVQYQVDPGGFPIHRLPELITSWPSKGIGQVTVAPSVRAAYLIEDQSGNQSGLLQGNLGLGLPRWQPNSFCDMGFYGGANASYYFQDRSQSVLNLGLGTNQHWHPRFSTNLNLETQPVYTTGIGTPFNPDRATAVDRVLFGCNWAVYGPWNVGVGGFYARQWTDPLALSSFKLGDLYYNFRYNVNCLSWGITFRPPRPDQNQPFQYFFDFNIITF